MALATETFAYTGAVQQWTVPPYITQVTVKCWGAQGGPSGAGDTGGLGGYAEGVLTVNPGETLSIVAGGVGSGTGIASGGFNGGGQGYGDGSNTCGGGGGASDVRRGGGALADRVVVAAGGGGSAPGAAYAGGGGGGLSGLAGGGAPYSGDGGTQTGGGAGQSDFYSEGTAGNGSLGAGGVGFKGGGGGGGYYGGGGGAGSQTQFTGGGGGSSLISLVTNGATTAATNTGPGRVEIVYEANVRPNAATWTFPDNRSVAADESNTLTWQFNDPNPGDTQSAYSLKRYELDANDNRVGAPVTTYAATPLSQHTIAPGTLTAGKRYEFQVSTFDSEGLEGPYSASLFLTAAVRSDAPQWLDPTSGQTVPTESYTGTISAPNVDASEWTLYADNAGSIDTATILQGPVTKTTGDLRSHTWTGLANNTTVWWSVRIKDGGLWSQPAQIRTPVSYTAVAAPTVALTGYNETGVLVVTITNPAPTAGEPSAAYNNIEVNDGDGWVKVAAMLPTNTSWTYHTPASGRDYAANVRVTTVGSNGTSATSGLPITEFGGGTPDTWYDETIGGGTP